MEKAGTSGRRVKPAQSPGLQNKEGAVEKLEDLLVGLKTKEDWQLERVEDVEKLTEIIHTCRVNRARSKEIARAIIKFVKEG